MNKRKGDKDREWKKMCMHYPFHRVNRDRSRTLPEEAHSKESNVILREYLGFTFYIHWHLNHGISSEVYNSDGKFLAETWCPNSAIKNIKARTKYYIRWYIKHNHIKAYE